MGKQLTGQIAACQEVLRLSENFRVSSLAGATSTAGCRSGPSGRVRGSGLGVCSARLQDGCASAKVNAAV